MVQFLKRLVELTVCKVITHDQYIIKKANQSHYRPEVPRGFQKVKVPDYVTMAQDGGKVVSLTHRPLLTLILLVLISVRG